MRYRVVVIFFLGAWSLMIFQLYQISIKSNYYYQNLARQNIERTNYSRPVRGEIVDTNGEFLAINKIGFSLSLAPHLERKGSVLPDLIEKVSSIFSDINKSVMHRVYKKGSSPYNHDYIKVIDFVEYNKMIRAYPAFTIDDTVHISAETKRVYPQGKLAAHITGYIGRSNRKDNKKDPVVKIVGKIGKSGLERHYNTLLQGELGRTVNKVNARNQALEVLEKKETISNRNVTVYLDMRLQKHIYSLLKGRAAVVVVMRTTGEVLAAVSSPSYDPNLFVGGISTKNWKALQNDLGHPFTNRLINAVYPPGSVIKMGVALATSQFDKKVLDRDENCTGFIQIGSSKHKFRCWSKWGHGKVGLRRSIRESCDVYYYRKSLDVGIDNIAKTLKSIGLGVKTGIDLPLEYHGIIPNKAWKMKRYKQSWYMGETAIAAIGQGYDNITPMQVARHTAYMATGLLPTPMLAKEINGVPTKPTLDSIAFDAGHMRQIRLGMIDVCNHKRGTAYKTMSKLPIRVAGKTGTAQVVSIPQDVKERAKEEDLEYFKKSHAWITTYAPTKKPEYVVTVLLEHGEHGGSSAGPIAADIYKWLYATGHFKNHSLKKIQAEMRAVEAKKKSQALPVSVSASE